MNSSQYSDNELHLMSYQDLRRLSILLQLPANIKKKYMISMIQAHQKGDGCLKTAIANKIMEERKVKRLSTKKKQSKSCLISSSVDSEQIPTDLSVSTQHEIETRFSYVAHYSSKDEISSGISRIIKQEAEVSRRNRSILQPRKPTRKLSTVGRTEIMLPRNHSLTTPVRLMPQYERGFPSPGDYEPMPGLPNPKNHFQDLNYNYHFHGEFSNALMPTTSHELYRSEPYWHTRDVYNNSLMPILSSLLTQNSVTINSSSYASQYTSNNSMKGSTSFQQGVYENYIKSNGLMESQAFQSGVTNTSTIIVNSHQMLNDSGSNNYNVGHGSYLITKGDVDFDMASASNEINCQHCYKRDDSVIKNTNESSGYLEFYTSRNSDPSKSPQPPYVTNMRDIPKFSSGCFREGHKEMALPVLHRPYESSPAVPCRTSELVEPDVSTNESELPMIDDYESSYTEEEKLWEEHENGLKKLIGKGHAEKENFVEGFLTPQNQGSFLSEVSDTSTTFSTEGEPTTDKTSKGTGRELLSYMPNLPRCRYTFGHNKYPEAASDSSKISLPSFLSTFCTNELYNKAYSVCKNSFTGTTETHLNPIMTCTYASEFSSHANSQQAQVNNTGSGMQRPWYYAYPEPQIPYSVASSSYSTWNEYSNELDNKIIAQNNNHNVQVVKCRTHGCHYLYSITNSCD